MGRVSSGVLAIDDLLRRAERLHTAPEIAVSLLRLTRDEHFDIEQVADCITRDPALSARILRVVNSSLYGLRSEVHSLRHALLLCGYRTVRVLALTFTIVDALTKGPARRMYLDYWRRALTMAVVASRLAARGPAADRHQAYTLGLLADIGMLVVASADLESYATICRSSVDGDELAAAERQVYGFDHAEVTARLLERWRFEPAFVAAAEAHHHDSAMDSGLLASIRASSLMADVLWNRESSQGDALRRTLDAGFGLDLQGFGELALTAREEILLEAEAFGFDLGRPVDGQKLLEEARQRCIDAALETALDLDSLQAVIQNT